MSEPTTSFSSKPIQSTSLKLCRFKELWVHAFTVASTVRLVLLSNLSVEAWAKVEADLQRALMRYCLRRSSRNATAFHCPCNNLNYSIVLVQVLYLEHGKNQVHGWQAARGLDMRATFASNPFP